MARYRDLLADLESAGLDLSDLRTAHRATEEEDDKVNS